MQLGEEEYFAQRLPEIAELAGAARKRAIAALEKDNPAVFSSYQEEKRQFEAGNQFARSCGRFDLTARGKVNTYALFAELFANLASKRGRAGVIVPTGIATDATTVPFFAALVESHRLARFIDFENRDAIFPAVHRSYKFSLLTIGREVKQASFFFFLTGAAQVAEPERRFTLSPEEIARINPNTKTAPVFRSRADAELTAKIYARVPIFARDSSHESYAVDLVQNFFSTSNKADTKLFAAAKSMKPEGTLSVLRGTMVDQFDHRAATHDKRARRFRELDTRERNAMDLDFST